MQGEVNVPYTPIGGSNMSRMAEPRISGSSQPSDGGASTWLSVRWSLPGGIVDKGSWYYLEGQHPGPYTTDNAVYEILNQNGLSAASDEEKETFINHYLYDAVSKFLHGSTYPAYGGWDEFERTYIGCWSENL